MSVSYYQFKNHLFLFASEGDCIDLVERRLISIDIKNPKTMQSHDILTGHHEDAVFSHKDNLYYWSEWFCAKESNKEAETNGAYLFKFDPATSKFNKVHFKQKEGCYPSVIEKSLKKNRLKKEKPTEAP